ncbi:MAG: bacteriohemerythrin [Candidatus Sedimenticola sp. PURPLELP]
MTAITWSRDLETGIEVIDEQHRRIVDYINELEAASREDDRESIGGVIKNLVNYTVSHFSFEESLMEDANYQFIDPHKKIHALFIRRVNEFVNRFNQGEDVATELSEMLQNWLISHIQKEDFDYVEAAGEQMQKKVSGGWLSSSLKRFFG